MQTGQGIETGAGTGQGIGTGAGNGGITCVLQTPFFSFSFNASLYSYCQCPPMNASFPPYC